MNTLAEIWKQNRSIPNYSLLLGVINPNNIDLMDEWKKMYAKNSLIFDKNFVLKYGNFKFLGDDMFDTQGTRFNDSVNYLLLKNKYKYETLYNTTVQEYNPIENYNRLENIQRTFDSHTDSTTNSSGAQTNSTEFNKAQTITTTNQTLGGATDETTNTIGSRQDSSSNTEGARSDITNTSHGTMNVNNSNVAFDNTSDYLVNKSITSQGDDSVSLSKGAQTNTNSVTTGAQTNVTENVIDERTNTQTVNENARKDTEVNTIGAKNDNSSSIYGERKEHENNHITGNIGTVSTQSMLEQERSIAMFSFYDVVFADIINEFFILLEEEV